MNAPEVVFPYLNIQINKLGRIAFSIPINADFSLDIYWYGIIIVSGIFIAYLWAVREAKITGQNPDIYSDFLPLTLVTCIIGARLYYVIFEWNRYKNDLLSILNIRQGGLAIYGAVIAAVITAYFYTKHKQVSFKTFTDTAIPSLVLGQAIGRIGNFFNREVFGGYTESLFAMRYLASQVDFIPQSVLNDIFVVNGIEYIQVHPTFLYESVWNFALFLFLQFYKKHKKFEGELMYVYLLGYGIGRFFIEGIRTDQLILAGTGIPVSMLLSAVLAATAVFVIVPKHIKASKKGFTLMELTVALGIIAILTAVLLPNVINYLSKANATAAHSNAKAGYNAAVQVMAAKASGLEPDSSADADNIKGLLTGTAIQVKIVASEPEADGNIGNNYVYIYVNSSGTPIAAYFETKDSVYPAGAVTGG